MNQGKLEVVKQEMARANIDIWEISELKWTGMDEFNSEYFLDNINFTWAESASILFLHYYQVSAKAKMCNLHVWNIFTENQTGNF